jgi:hypothetical protein
MRGLVRRDDARKKSRCVIGIVAERSPAGVLQQTARQKYQDGRNRSHQKMQSGMNSDTGLS